VSDIKKDRPIDLVYRSIEDATTPREGYVAKLDRWWVAHPERGIAFAKFRGYLAPQCNHDRRLPEHMVREMYPGHEVIHLDVVFVPQEREA